MWNISKFTLCIIDGKKIHLHCYLIKQDSICKNFIRYAQDGYNGERLKPKTN